MRIRTKLDISCLKIDRLPIGPRTTALMDHLRSGGTVPPIHVQPDGLGTFFVLDGRHRVLAYKMLGIPEIDVRYGEPQEPQGWFMKTIKKVLNLPRVPILKKVGGPHKTKKTIIFRKVKHKKWEDLQNDL